MTKRAHKNDFLSEETALALKAGFQGDLTRPGEPDYDRARRTWNRINDTYPALIARCHGVEDVIAAIDFAREHELPLAVHGGGHSMAGFSAFDGGLVIDLSLLKQVVVDPEARLARVGAGATLGNIDRVTQHYGLATPTGIISTAGIASLTLNGGLGWLRRKYGLSVDNLLAVEMVTADGRLLRASETENPDLFWAVRGGGDNFGVVVSFEFRLYEVGPEILFLMIMYPLAQAQAIFTAWRDWTRTSPEEASTDCLIWNIPASILFPKSLYQTPVVTLTGMYAGPTEEGLRLFQQLRDLGEAVLDETRPMAFPAAQSLFDPYFPEGLYHHTRSVYLDEFSDQAIAATIAHATQRPSLKTAVSVRHLGGAMGRVDDTETAVANRRAQYLLSIDSTWADSRADGRTIAWTRHFMSDMHRFSGDYINPGFSSQGEEGWAHTRVAYGPNHARLIEVKTKYDPSNLFRQNHR